MAMAWVMEYVRIPCVFQNALVFVYNSRIPNRFLCISHLGSWAHTMDPWCADGEGGLLERRMRARHATVHATIAIDTHGHNNTADAVQQGELAAFSQLQLCSSTARHVASAARVF